MGAGGGLHDPLRSTWGNRWNTRSELPAREAEEEKEEPDSMVVLVPRSPQSSLPEAPSVVISEVESYSQLLPCGREEGKEGRQGTSPFCSTLTLGSMITGDWKALLMILRASLRNIMKRGRICRLQRRLQLHGFSGSGATQEDLQEEPRCLPGRPALSPGQGLPAQLPLASSYPAERETWGNLPPGFDAPWSLSKLLGHLRGGDLCPMTHFWKSRGSNIEESIRGGRGIHV
ncbi:uncharacterized protein LOC140701654 [Pogona vitticeps]